MNFALFTFDYQHDKTEQKHIFVKHFSYYSEFLHEFLSGIRESTQQRNEKTSAGKSQNLVQSIILSMSGKKSTILVIAPFVKNVGETGENQKTAIL